MSDLELDLECQRGARPKVAGPLMTLSTRAPSPKPLDEMDPTMTAGISSLEKTKSTATNTQSEPNSTTSSLVITENVITKECKVSILRLPEHLQQNSTGRVDTRTYNMRTRPSSESITHRTSERPRNIIDYSQFMAETEEDTSPPRKKRTVNLLHTPSSSHIAAENFHTKPTTTPRPIWN